MGMVILMGAMSGCGKNSPTEPENGSPPYITSFSVEPSEGYAPLEVTFSWSIGDPDNEALTCEIDVDNNGTPEKTISNCTSSDTYSYTYTSPGTYIANLKVIDASGNYTSKSITINVYRHSNSGPEIQSFSASPNFGYAPLDVLFTWSISDPENDPLVCEIDADGDGTTEYTINNCSSSSNYTYTYTSMGNYQAQLTVKDTAGNSVSEHVNVRICGTIDIVDQEINVGTRSDYEIYFNGQDGDTLHLYASVVDGNDISQMLVIYNAYEDTLYVNTAFTYTSDDIYLPYTGRYRIVLRNTSYTSSKIYYIWAYLKRCPQ